MNFFYNEGISPTFLILLFPVPYLPNPFHALLTNPPPANPVYYIPPFSHHLSLGELNSFFPSSPSSSVAIFLQYSSLCIVPVSIFKSVVKTMADMKMEESAKEYIYRSKLPNIDIPYHLPLHTFCFQNIDDYRDKPCIINGGTDEVYTYGEVELTARRVAAGLYRLGLKQGDVIMILLHNSPEFVFAFLGASVLGAISTTANPLYTPQEIAKQANAAGAKAIVTQACYVEKVRDMADERGMKVVCIDAPPPGCSHFSELIGADEGDLPEVEILPDDVVALPYSSGTTGLPKGVMLTHKGQVTSVSQQIGGDNPNLYLGRYDVVLFVLPLFHIYSLSTLFCGLRTGAAMVMVQRFEIGALMEVIQKYKVTMAPIVPPIVLAIVKSPLVDEYDLSSIRRVMSGAAPMGKELEDVVRAKLPNAKLGQVVFFS